MAASSLVALTGVATGAPPLRYQWLLNGGALNGETNNTLIFPSIVLSNAGLYTLRVTNSLGSAEATAQLTVTTSLLFKRSTLALALGARGAFEALPGTNLFAYQWSFDGSDLPGETNRVLGFPSATIGQTGYYKLRATSAGGFVDGQAHLEVVTTLSDSLMADYHFDGNGLDAGPNGLHGSLSGPTATTDRFGFAGQALFFNGAGAEVVIPDSPNWYLGASNFTIVLWARLQSAGDYALVSQYTEPSGPSQFQFTTYGGYYYFHTVWSDLNQVGSALTPPPGLFPGQWKQIGVIRNGSSIRFILDGQSLLGNAPTTSGPLNDGTEPIRIGGRGHRDLWFHGAMDGLRVWNRSLSDTEVAALFASESPEWLAITQQPMGSTNVAGTNLVLSVAATGVGTLNYQWRFNGANLLGATNTALTITNARPIHAGSYSVVVSNASGSITSQVATLTVFWPTNLISANAGALTSSGGNTVAAGSADYNGDGWNDVFLSNTGADPSYLLRNLTNGTFGATSGDPNVPAAGNLNSPYTPVFADYDNDGRLDLYLTFLQGQDGLATTNRLYRNLDGTNFLRITNAGLPVTLVANSDSAAWADLDADGWVDLVVAYRNRSQVGVYRNLGDGTFSDFTATANLNISALSVSLGDYDDDGRLDVASLSADYPNSVFKLFRNLGGFSFTNLTNTTITPAPEAFIARWLDYNNDGKLDLRLYGFNQLAQIWTNSGTGAFSLSFQSTNCGVATADFNLDGRIDEVPLAGSVAADLNHDGLPDMFKATGANEQLWTNQWNGAGWLVVKLVGQQSNRTGIGAKIRATATIDGVNVTQTRQISGGEGYGSFVPLEANFGFGDATNISLLRIEWPSGKVQQFTNVAPNQFLTIQEQTAYNFGVNGFGSVSYSPVKSNYFVGETITLTASTNRYYRFVQWSDGNTNAVRNYTVGLSNVLTAMFTNTVPLEAVVLKQWEASFGGTNSDSAQVVRATSDGGFLIGCSSASGVNGNKLAPNWGGTDIWLIKVNSAGVKQWEQTFGGTSNDSVQDILQTADGGCLVLANSLSGPNGSKTAANFGDYDAWLLKVDSSGGKLWEKSYGGSAQDIVSSIAPTSDGGFVMCGSSLSAPGSGGGNRTAPFVGTLGQQPDLWVIRIDSLGNMLWDKSFGPPGGSSGDNITVATDGKLWIAGHVAGAAGYLGGMGGVRTSPSPGGIGDIWLLNLDANGVFQWERSFGGPGYEDGALHNGCLLADGSFALVARYNIGTNESGYIVRVSPEGITRYEQTYGGSGKDEFKTLDTAKDGGVLVGGESDTPLGNGTKTSPKYGGADYWITKLDAQLNKKWEYSYGGSGSNETILHLLSTADGGFVVAGSSDSLPGSGGGNKTSASYGSGDVWVIKLSDTEQPIGTPVVLVNGLYAISNAFVIPATNVPVQVSLQTSLTNAHIFYTLDGTTPSSNSLAYTTNFSLIYSTTIRAIAYNSNYTAAAEADPVVVSIAPYVFFTSSVGSGTVTRSPNTNSYTLGQQVTLTATPSRYYAFVRWSDGVTATNRTITVGSGNVFTAIFTNTVLLEPVVLKIWERVFGGTGDDYAHDIQRTSDGGFVLAGYSNSGSNGNKSRGNFGGYDGWVVKVDSNGDKQWEQNVGGSSDDQFDSVRQLPNGDYILAGNSFSGVSGNKTSPNYGFNDAWLVRLDVNGNIISDYTFGGSDNDYASSVEAISEGGYIVVGRSQSGISGNKTSANNGNRDFFVIKLDSALVKQWDRSFGGTADDDAFSARQSADGAFFVAGQSASGISGNKTNASFGGKDFWALKLDSNGVKIWEHVYGGNTDEVFDMASLTGDGGFVMAGRSHSNIGGNKAATNYGDSDFWIVKSDSFGDKLWDQSAGGIDGDEAFTVQQCPDGGYLAAGRSPSSINGNKTSSNFGNEDGWIVKLNASGVKLWDCSFGGTGDDVFYAAKALTDGGNVFAGYSDSPTSGNKSVANFGLHDYWAVKVSDTEQPIGTPVVLVNGLYAISNAFVIPATNVPVQVSLQTSFTNAHIFYTVDGTAPSSNSLAYAANFSLIYSTTIRAIAYNSNYTAAAEADPVVISIAPYVFFTGSVGSGTVTRSPDTNSYSLGQQVTLTATPNRYYTFVRWSDGVTTTNRTITVGSGSAFTAIFTNTVPLETAILQQWQQSFGGTNEDYIISVVATGDGGYLLGGESKSGASGNKTSGNFGGFDLWLVKVDANGSKQWETNYGGTGEDRFRCLALTSDGGYIMGGQSDSGVSGNKTTGNFGSSDAWLLKLAADGSKQWETNYGGSSGEDLRGFAQTSDGGYILGCASLSGASGNKTTGNFGLWDEWILKVDSSGVKQWEANYGGNNDDYLNAIAVLADGNIILGGHSWSSPSGNKTSGTFGETDFWFVKLNSAGAKLWETNYGGLLTDALTTITLTPDGGLIAGGYTTSGASGNKTSGNYGGFDCWLVKLNEHGFKQWETNYGGTLNDGIYSIAPSGDGGYVVGGFSASGANNGNKTSTNFGGQDFWTLKLDALGRQSAEVTYGGNANDSINSLVRTSDGGYLLGGYSPSGVNGNKTSPNFGLDDFWLVKAFVQEAPIGMPVISLDSLYSPTNIHLFANGIHSVSIQSTFTNAHIFYTVDGTTPSSNSLAYTTNFTLVYSTTIRAIAYNSNYTAAAEADPVVVSIAPYVFFTGSVGSGTVTRSPNTNSYSLGQQVTLTATPSRYYAFVRWSDGVTATNRTITVGSGSVFTAIFTNTVLLEELVFKQWDRSYGGSSNDELTAIQAASDGGYLLGGYSSSGISGNKTNAGFGNTDYWIVKVDATGSKQWERIFGGGAEDSLFAVQRTGAGGYYLGGISSSGVSGNKTNSGYGNQDFWVVKTDSNGNKLWDYTYGGTGNDRLQDMAVTPDGGFIAIGSSTSGASGNKTSGSFGLADIWCVRANANGEIVWQQSFGGNADDVGYRVKLTDDGGFAIAGSSASAANSGGGNKTTPNYGLRDFWFLRLDANGVKVAEQTIGGFNEDRANALVQTGDGGFALAGWSRSDIEGNKTTLHCNSDDGWLVRLGATGSLLSDVDIGGSGQDEFATSIALTDGSLMLAGSSDSAVSCNKSSAPLGGLDYWLIRTDHNGGKKWEYVFGGTGTDSLQALSETPDGGLLLGGLSDSGVSGNKSATNSGLTDFWVVRLDTREAPIGMPAVLVNGNFSPTNYFPFPATNGVQVTFQTTYPNGSIFYTVDGSQPDPGSAFYDGSPIGLSNSAVIRAVAFDESFVESQECDPVTISFIPIYTFTATTAGGGSISFSPTNGPYLSNSVVTFTATPSNGWVFMNWTGAATSTNPLLNLTLDSNKSLQAVFGTFVSNTIAPAGFGAVTREPAQGPYPYGSSVRMSAVPATGKYFIRWTGAANGLSNSPIDFVVTVPNTNASTLFATLSANVFALTTLVDGNGTVTKSPQLQNYTNGQSVMLTATNGPGYTFVGWSGDASGTANPINVTMNTNKLVTATFSTTAPPSNSPPTISITNPVDGMTFVAPTNLIISGTASDLDGTVTQIQLRYSTNLLATLTNAAFGFNWTNPPVGTNVLTAVATDNGGLSTTSSPVSIVVQTAIPQIFLTGPSNNATFVTPANITLSAVATDNDSTISNVTLYAGTNLLTTLTTPPPTYSFTWSNVAVGSYTLSARVQDSYGPIVTSAPVNITVSAPAGTNPPVFRFNPGSYTVNASNGSISLTVVNDGDLGGLVNFATVDVTAYGGSGYSGDYTTQLGSLTFTGGQHSATITIGLRNNFLNAPDVSFQVQLFQPSAGTLGSPAVANVTIQRTDPSGATNSLTTISVGSGQPPTSSALQVMLTPAEVGGQWRFPWDLGWRTNGATASSLEAGNYPVEFRNVSNHVAYPATITVAVTNGGTTPATGGYYPGLESGSLGVGSLTVNISPNAPVGSGWRLFGETSYRAPNATVANLLPDTYFVEFASVGGWTKPATRAVEVAAGQGTTVFDNYLLPQSLPPGAGTPGQLLHSQIVNPASFPYWFNGQLQTDVGFGSGVVVRETVVLTAAHMVFNDVTLSYVNRAWWHYQKETGVFDPKPNEARGWYVLSGYAAQRTNDIPNPPAGAGTSSAASRNLDVAALYFTAPAARGGFGGYLASDVVPNPWLTDATKNKMLVGYPVDGSLFGQAVQSGRMYATPLQTTALNHATNHTYTTASFIGHPGNSGGPVYVAFNGYYYPAAVYLGTLGSGVNSVSAVRAINSEVVNLINLASSLGDAGTNNNGGGVITLLAPSVSAVKPAYVQVLFGPPAAVQAGAGWRLSGDATYGTTTNYIRTITTTNATIEFKPLVGWNPPAISSYSVQAGALTTIPGANYTPIVPASPSWLFLPGTGFGLSGTTNTQYRIEYTTNLASGLWTPLQTNLITTAGFNLVLPLPPTNNLPAAFYRAVWLP